MSFLKKTSFASGEIDPSLHDLTDVKSYYSGLKTARNVTIGKTGRILNTAGTWYYDDTASNDKGIRVYVPEIANTSAISTPHFFEFGEGYVKVNLLSEIKDQNYRRPIAVPIISQVGSFYNADDLLNLRFATIKRDDGVFWTYVACKGKRLEAFTFNGSTLIRDSKNGIFGVPVDYPQVAYIAHPPIPVIPYVFPADVYIKHNVPSAGLGGMTTRFGHDVQYGVTLLTDDGQESPIYQIFNYISSDNVLTSSIKLPTGTELTGFYIEQIGSVISKYSSKVIQFNIYRRPIYQAGVTSDGKGFSWGLIGQSSISGSLGVSNNTALKIGFTDFGQVADYSNPPPEQSVDVNKFVVEVGAPTPTAVNRFYTNIENVIAYQGRLMMIAENYILASKVNHPNYFLRDFPITETTSFTLQVGTSGKIFHAIESNGLIVFTSEGIFYGGFDSPVSSVNPIVPKRGKLIIDETVKPINTPYGVFFIDRATNSIKTLDYSNDAKAMSAEDVSLFSDHLFYLRKVMNWVFKEGNDPHLEVVMDDGAVLHLSYNKSEKIMAWTRHDTLGTYEDVETYFDTSTGQSHSIYILKRGSLSRQIEISSRRILKDLFTRRSFSHATVRYENDYLSPETDISLALTTTSWSDPLIWPSAFVGAYHTARVGKTFIAYTADRKERVYLKLLSVVSGTSATFMPDRELPLTLRSLSVPRMFHIIECHTQVTGLVHLEGKKVSVVSDGDVLSSPNNDHVETQPAQVLTVAAGGILTLPEPKGETIVGLPYISDIQTLEIDNKNGSDLVNTKLNNKIFVNYSRTRGGYVSGKFPPHIDNENIVELDVVKGMENADAWNRFDSINFPLSDKTVRRHYSIYSDYQANGSIAIRQVDPLPLEVVSIVLDIVGG